MGPEFISFDRLTRELRTQIESQQGVPQEQQIPLGREVHKLEKLLNRGTRSFLRMIITAPHQAPTKSLAYDSRIVPATSHIKDFFQNVIPNIVFFAGNTVKNFIPARASDFCKKTGSSLNKAISSVFSIAGLSRSYSQTRNIIRAYNDSCAKVLKYSYLSKEFENSIRENLKLIRECGLDPSLTLPGLINLLDSTLFPPSKNLITTIAKSILADYPDIRNEQFIDELVRRCEIRLASHKHLLKQNNALYKKVYESVLSSIGTTLKYVAEVTFGLGVIAFFGSIALSALQFSSIALKIPYFTDFASKLTPIIGRLDWLVGNAFGVSMAFAFPAALLSFGTSIWTNWRSRAVRKAYCRNKQLKLNGFKNKLHDDGIFNSILADVLTEQYMLANIPDFQKKLLNKIIGQCELESAGSMEKGLAKYIRQMRSSLKVENREQAIISLILNGEFAETFSDAKQAALIQIRQDMLSSEDAFLYAPDIWKHIKLSSYPSIEDSLRDYKQSLHTPTRQEELYRRPKPYADLPVLKRKEAMRFKTLILQKLETLSANIGNESINIPLDIITLGALTPRNIVERLQQALSPQQAQQQVNTLLRDLHIIQKLEHIHHALQTFCAGDERTAADITELFRKCITASRDSFATSAQAAQDRKIVITANGINRLYDLLSEDFIERHLEPAYRN